MAIGETCGPWFKEQISYVLRALPALACCKVKGVESLSLKSNGPSAHIRVSLYHFVLSMLSPAVSIKYTLHDMDTHWWSLLLGVLSVWRSQRVGLSHRKPQDTPVLNPTPGIVLGKSYSLARFLLPGAPQSRRMLMESHGDKTYLIPCRKLTRSKRGARPSPAILLSHS